MNDNNDANNNDANNDINNSIFEYKDKDKDEDKVKVKEKENDIINSNNIIYDNPFNNPNDNPFIMYKKKTNKEFRDYILNNLKDKNIYDIIDGQLIFKLRRIGNIKSIVNKIVNPKDIFLHNLNYKIHKNKIATLIDDFLELMTDKGYYFDFDNYYYQLFERDTEIPLLKGGSSREPLFPSQVPFFVKIYKYKKIVDDSNNINTNNTNNNTTNNNTTLIRISLWLFHNNIMHEYIH
jgi:hypothetical protein